MNAALRALGLALVVLAGCTPSRPAPTVLRVGSSGDYAPFSIRNGADWIGFDVEVAKRFAHDSGRELQLVDFRWPALELDLADDRYDVAMSGVTMRPWRARVGSFTRPVARVGAMVLARPDAGSSLAALDTPGKRIGVNAGGYLERVARRLFRRAEVVSIADNRQVAAQLSAGAVDAIVTDELEMPIFRRAVPDSVVIGPLTNDRKAYLARDPALAAELDAWMRAREVDGWLPGLRARMLGPKWGMAHAAAASDLDALLALIELRLAFMPAVAVAKEQQGLPTTDAAQEAQVLAQARERARLLGADPDRVAALFTAMMQASRDVQDEIRGMPEQERPVVESMDLERDARPALARVSALIVERAADVEHAPEIRPLPTPALVADALDSSLASSSDRLAIADAVVALLPGDTDDQVGKAATVR